MKNLSLSTIRRIILEEMQNILQDDALFSRDELTDIGTGTLVGLTPLEDEEDLDADYLEPQSAFSNAQYNDVDDQASCSICGVSHDTELPCGE